MKAVIVRCGGGRALVRLRGMLLLLARCCPSLAFYVRLLPSAAGYCQGTGGRDGRDGWPATKWSCRLLLQLLLLACRCLLPATSWRWLLQGLLLVCLFALFVICFMCFHLP